jgi:hypothetical protein
MIAPVTVSDSGPESLEILYSLIQLIYFLCNIAGINLFFVLLILTQGTDKLLLRKKYPDN